MVCYPLMRPCDLLIALCKGALSALRPYYGIVRILGQTFEPVGVFFLEDRPFFQEGSEIL